jgi:hypothetical protein
VAEVLLVAIEEVVIVVVESVKSGGCGRKVICVCVCECVCSCGENSEVLYGVVPMM